MRTYHEEPRCYFVDAEETELVCSRLPRAVCGKYAGGVVDPYALEDPPDELCFYDETCGAAWYHRGPLLAAPDLGACSNASSGCARRLWAA